MTDDAVTIERPEPPEQLEDWLDDVRENDDTVLKLDINDKGGVVQYQYDHDGEALFLLVLESGIGIPKRKMQPRDILLGSLAKTDGLSVEKATVEEAADEQPFFSESQLQPKEHPYDAVHIFVKSVDDGRYKDDVKFVEDDLDDLRDHEDWTEIGTIRSIIEDDITASYDFKQSMSYMGREDVGGLLKEEYDQTPQEFVRDRLGA